MPESQADPSPAPGLGEQIATRAAFFVAGFTVSAWAPLIPIAKARLGLDDAQLGSLLLCLGFGSITTMPFAGGLAARFGCRRVILAAAGALCLMLPVMASAPSGPAAAAALAVFGAGLGTLDVAMNVQASIVEKAAGRAMMSGFHAMYTVGGLIGAGAVTGLLTAGWSSLPSALAISAAAAAVLATTRTGLLLYGGSEKTPVIAFPRGPVLLLGSLAFVLMLAEHSVLDWGGVLLASVRGLDKSQAGIGYMAFCFTVSIGRLLGDSLIRALGHRRVLLWGSIAALACLLGAALAPSWPLTVLGFACFGLTTSNLVPAVMSLAGRQTIMPRNLALSSVTTMGYIGILMGPALIGTVARAASLPLGLSLAAALLALVAGSSSRAAP